MNNTYMTVETTNLEGSVCFSVQAEEDIQNGAIVGKGDLISDEDSIYEALSDYTNGMYLVANPAWNYDDSRLINQNEENYINKANTPFRTYKLEKDMKFKIGNINAEFEKGDFVEYKDGTYSKAAGTSSLKIVKVEETGFPFFVGSYGVKVTGDTSNEYGYALNMKTKQYTIQVME